MRAAAVAHVGAPPEAVRWGPRPRKVRCRDWTPACGRWGAWLLVGYTVALVLMTFAGERLLPPPASEVAEVEVVAYD